MDGGESRTEIAIAHMLEELKYQSEINESPVFEYAVQYVKGIGRYLDASEQSKVLKVMDSRGLIVLSQQKYHNNASSGFSLIEGEESRLTQSLMSTRCSVDTTNTEWPIAPRGVVSNTHLVRLNYRDGVLSLSIDGDDYHNIAKLSDGLKPFKIFEALFSKSTGVVIPSADIFSQRLNLRQIITKSNLGYILPFLDESVFPYNVARKNQELRLPPSELKILLSKLNEKYRNSFADYL